jgi:hypothetical protein
VNMLLEALSDAWGRRRPLAFVAAWRAALAGLDERPALCSIVRRWWRSSSSCSLVLGAGGSAIGAGDSFRPTKKLPKGARRPLGRDYRPFAQVRLADPAPGLSELAPPGAGRRDGQER